MKRHKERGIPWSIFSLAAVVLSGMLSGCTFINVSLYRAAQPLEEKVIDGEGPGKVLLMDISGVLL